MEGSVSPVIDREPIVALPKPPPLLVVVSGPSGVGKDVTLKRMKEIGAPFHFLVTNTTRPRRPNEVEGVDYHFVTAEEFEHKLAADEFLEHAVVYGFRYGNSRREVQAALDRGEDVILRIDVQGAATIRRRVENAVFIFLFATPAQLEARLRARRTEPEDALRKRLETAATELEQMGEFDYVVDNRDGQLDATVDNICSILTAEKLRAHPRRIRFR